MEPFTILRGRAAPMKTANVDTDIIIRIERYTTVAPGDLGRYAFESVRYLKDGSENPDFVLNKRAYRGASILLAGPNFGCGSSREMAVVALMRMGIRCVIAESFGDIFHSNCFQNGLLPVRLPEVQLLALMRESELGDPTTTVDLERQLVISPSGREYAFVIDPLRRKAMLAGLDDIGLTMEKAEEIASWQSSDKTARPWVWNISDAAG